MNPRVKWLLAAGAAVFGLYGVDASYRSYIEEPSRTLNDQIDSLTSDLNAAEQDQFKAQKIGKRLEGYRSRALPSDPQLARSLYQEWLLQLVDSNQIEAAAINAGQPNPIEIRSRTKKNKKNRIGYRISFNLRGQANLNKLSSFLDAFRKAGHLHKVTSLSLNPIGNEGRLDVNLTIEVLSMENAINDKQLGDWSMTDDAIASLPTYEPFVRRNLFARGFAKALNDIELKAITFNREGKAEAWFTIDSRGSIKTQEAGSNLPLALHDIAVVEVLQDRVLLSINQDKHWIQLGESIGDILTKSNPEPTNP